MSLIELTENTRDLKIQLEFCEDQHQQAANSKTAIMETFGDVDVFDLTV